MKIYMGIEIRAGAKAFEAVKGGMDYRDQ